MYIVDKNIYTAGQNQNILTENETKLQERSPIRLVSSSSSSAV